MIKGLNKAKTRDEQVSKGRELCPEKSQITKPRIQIKRKTQNLNPKQIKNIFSLLFFDYWSLFIHTGYNFYKCS